MLRVLPRLCLLLLMVIGIAPIIAQEAAPASPTGQTVMNRTAIVYAGPGDTFRQLGVLRAGHSVALVERNRIGNWLHIRQNDRNGFVRLDGWVMTGSLTLPPEVRFSQVPVNITLPDADPSNVDNALLQQLYAVPVISDVSDRMRQVYRLGQTLGMHSYVITKVGDSLSFNPMYLEPMSRNDNDLGPYDYLADALTYFGPSAAPSAAASIGLNVFSVFDPGWKRKAQCRANESPLACEYRQKQPGVAFILFGPNDVRAVNVDKFRTQMQKIVEETEQRGIIPVLSTFSADPNRRYWDEAVIFNLAIVDVAWQYDVPLINLWAAARPLPDYGLDADHVHMKNSGFLYLKYSTGHESLYGTSLRNLLSLVMLDEILHTVILETDG
ncbi:MAG: hypothetical protein HZC41_09410 [Chloroflexi bacterium]|nr:hypothetical protein [Chloroflexota bacterium]